MSIPNYLLEYLTKNGKATLSGFGSFATENSEAVLNQENKTLLPPGKKISFQADYEVQDESFAQYLSAQKNISPETATGELRQQVDFWKNKINEGENFTIENLGEFKISGDSAEFAGNRIATDNSDFYGLEEINLNDLKKRTGNADIKKQEDSSAGFRFSKPLLWVLLLAIPLSGMIYVGAFHPEMLFGKKSSLSSPAKKKDVKKDSVKILVKPTVTDSLKADSLQKATVAAVPLKKWTPKSTKKHFKKKWQKPKKRATRSQ